MVFARRRSHEGRLQHKSAGLRLRLIGRLSHLSVDGHWYGDQLVYPAPLLAEARNDTSVEFRGYAPLGHVARYRFDGCRGTYVPGFEVESDRQNLSRAKRQPDGKKRLPDAVGRDRLPRHDRRDLPGAVL